MNELKKIIILLFICSLIVIIYKKEDDILIPNNAIRFRVVANSDSISDQNEKMIIKKNIEKEVYNLIGEAKNVVEANDILLNNIDNINALVKKYNVPYNISYGSNYFPTKNYKGILYPAGNYDSLVITLGEGAGSNFWCVLFPPLCLLDNESADVGEVEYKFYVKKLLDKF